MRRMSVLSSLLLLVHQLPLSTAQSPHCRLNCVNGGYCTYTSNDQAQLAHSIQSGQLIQQCICRPGFGGLGCEIPVKQCQLTDLTCNNGALPCTLTAAGDYTCDCHVADQVSKFAGDMCRKRYTEYCYTDPDDKTVVSFCTNGGKCKSGLMGAQLAPGNFTATLAMHHLGCVCNTAFYGPHCEFLKLPRDNNDGMSTTVEAPVDSVKLDETSDKDSAATAAAAAKQESGDTGSSGEPPLMNIIIASAAGFVSVLALFWTVKRIRQKRISRQHKRTQSDHLYYSPESDNAVLAAAAECASLTSMAGRNVI